VTPRGPRAPNSAREAWQRLRRVVGESDVYQSAVAQFALKLREGRYHFDPPGDLVGLLQTILLRGEEGSARGLGDGEDCRVFQAACHGNGVALKTDVLNPSDAGSCRLPHSGAGRSRTRNTTVAPA